MVVDYLNTTEESLMMKMAWEMMNPEYKKGMQRKPTSVKKKDPISKTDSPPSKKTFATTTLSNAESEKKKLNFLCLLVYKDLVHISIWMSWISYLMIKAAKKECLLEPEGSEEDAPEEDKLAWNKDYSTEEANGGEDEFYGGADLEYKNQDEAEYNEDIIW
ncbi:hypothetical protein F2Q70_00045224 [Brassica cretica]|uniref:Brf1 TBP-binding domain-containing protein n=1 Tax=Brassica cretica TaxID=69181 RepID=A0A8S9KJ97_BRACR|nr:hypothetical protein F2Q70_00045224 [Brassica cretica]